MHEAREKTLFDLASDAWASRYAMLFFGLLCLIGALIFQTLAQPFYRADMILSPVVPITGLVDIKPAQQEGTIAAGRGVVTNDLTFLRFENSYHGARVAKSLLQYKDIIDALAFDRPFEFSKAEQNWSPEKLSAYLKQRVTIEPVSGTPLRRMSYYHPDPAFAKRFIGLIHHVADSQIRQSVMSDVQERVAYLMKSIEKTNQKEQRRVLTDILMAQERLRMFVSLDQPFAAAVVEPPASSEKPSWPDPYLIYPISVLAGFLIGFMFHGLRKNG